MSIIKRVLLALELRSKKMADLADLLEVNSSTVANWKTRDTDPPSKYIIPICVYLNISVEWLLTGEGNMEKSKKDSEIVDACKLPKIEPQLSLDEESLLDCYREMTKDGKRMLQREAKNIWAECRNPSSKLSDSDTEIGEEISPYRNSDVG